MVFDVNGIVAAGTTAPLVNSVSAVLGGGISDPLPANNSAALITEAGDGDELFANGFEDSANP